MISRLALAEIALRISRAAATQSDARILLEEVNALRSDFALCDAECERTKNALVSCQEDRLQSTLGARLAIAASDQLRDELALARAEIGRLETSLVQASRRS